MRILHPLLLPLFFLFFLCSCREKKVDSTTAYNYYDSINHEISANKDNQQKLIDRLTNIILLISNDANANVDITSLQELLDSAKISNISRIKNIAKIEEIDRKINYKSKVLDYLKYLNDFYEIDTETFIKSLNTRTEDEFELAKKNMQPKLILIKEKELVFKEAQNEFEAKYGQPGPGKAGSKIVSPEYKLVNLSSLQFEKTIIADGTLIDLISYSGGDCSNTDLQYKQFIGIDQSNGDTVRILAFCQAQQYDLDKAPRSGIYKKSSIPLDSIISSGNLFVIFNKNLEEIENGNYKTAFGTLEFR